MPKLNLSHLPDWSASMREDRAVAYLDVGKTYFREKVAPQVPEIRSSPGMKLFRRIALEAWLNQQEGNNAAPAQANEWLQQDAGPRHTPSEPDPPRKSRAARST